jgi:hypothetical protein
MVAPACAIRLYCRIRAADDFRISDFASAEPTDELWRALSNLATNCRPAILLRVQRVDAGAMSLLIASDISQDTV